MAFFKTQIIELFGLPKTGKTTTVNALKKYMLSQNKSVEIVRERASICPIKDKLHPSFNYWTAISFMKEYVEANEKKIDYLIADRGIFDAYIWVDLLSKRLNNLDFGIDFEKLVSQNLILENYLMTFYFKAEFNVIMNREKERQIQKSQGRIMNSEILDLYSKSYTSIKPKLLGISKIIEIDSTINDIPKVLEEIAKHIDGETKYISQQG